MQVQTAAVFLVLKTIAQPFPAWVFFPRWTRQLLVVTIIRVLILVINAKLSTRYVIIKRILNQTGV